MSDILQTVSIDTYIGTKKLQLPLSLKNVIWIKIETNDGKKLCKWYYQGDCINWNAWISEHAASIKKLMI